MTSSSSPQVDASLKPDPDRKGGYHRRLQDVERGLKDLRLDGASDAMRFFALYFASEKIARSLVGIHKRIAATQAFKDSVRLDEIKLAAAALALSVPEPDLEWLFARHDEQSLLRPTVPGLTSSARLLRNNALHDFGPSNIALVTTHAVVLNGTMRSFIACIPEILTYQRINFSGIP